ncbi:hypothetical protein LSH36_184g05000 [Paralvinella palmiformis]|uniref:MADS-box domain-containing protein n=1 Tax=Paralvinella palmiformis TaxID=53620 RepID=A0AAD9JSF6_9ANNE|nr:hypothetical protein LSH36_184g05000 [Paralvinella palmiformis]
MGRKKIQISRIGDERNRQMLRKKEMKGEGEDYNLQVYQNQNMSVSVPVHSSPGYQSPNHPQQQANILSSIPTSNTLMPPHTLPQGRLSPRPNSTGGMMDLSAASNGYPQQHSPNPVGGGGGGAGGKVPSPPGVSVNSRRGLRVVIPNSQGDGINQARTSNAQLATPVVSIATPSNPGNGNFPSGLPSAFPSDFTADLQSLAGFNTPGGLPGQWSHTQGPLTAAVQAAGLTNPHLTVSLASVSAPSSNVHSAHHQMNIKSEPISPPQEATVPSSQQLRPPSTGHSHNALPGHISPNHISNGPSNTPSPVPPDYDTPSAKRQRLTSDGWPS